MTAAPRGWREGERNRSCFVKFRDDFGEARVADLDALQSCLKTAYS
jgi:hypothetical protein